MDQKAPSTLTDQELLVEAKEMKSFSIMNAFLIGFLAGIIFVSIYYSAYTLSLLIPLFFIYKFINDPKNKRAKEVAGLLKVRNLKL
ncbi:MAG: FUSC family protein [Pedobacter sp.]|nr:MAG: FUSC family protein [Pedobacter sp.]